MRESPADISLLDTLMIMKRSEKSLYGEGEEGAMSATALGINYVWKGVPRCAPSNVSCSAIELYY